VRQDKLARSSSACQCAHIEAVAPKLRVIIKHGMNNTREFKSWRSMKQRCLGLTPKHDRDYKARGITVCPEWESSFETFYRDLGPRPDGTTLDRIDNDLGYFPGNCRWATPTQQARNSRWPKLDEKKAHAIRSMKEAGFPSSRIAAIFEVTADTVRNVINGKHWTILSAEDADEHPTDAATIERQHPSQGTRLQPGSRDAGEAGAGPGETGVEGC
jgi:hypothetical protein